eukprot:527164-Rhodomonas_salina.1
MELGLMSPQAAGLPRAPRPYLPQGALRRKKKKKKHTFRAPFVLKRIPYGLWLVSYACATPCPVLSWVCRYQALAPARDGRLVVSERASRGVASPRPRSSSSSVDFSLAFSLFFLSSWSSSFLCDQPRARDSTSFLPPPFFFLSSPSSFLPPPPSLLSSSNPPILPSSHPRIVPGVAGERCRWCEARSSRRRTRCSLPLSHPPSSAKTCSRPPWCPAPPLSASARARVV